MNETIVEAAVDTELRGIYFTPPMEDALQTAIFANDENLQSISKVAGQALELQLSKLEGQQSKLLDFFIDEKIDQSAYDHKHKMLSAKIADVQADLNGRKTNTGQKRLCVTEYLERLKRLLKQRELGEEGLKAKFVKNASSNPTVWQKNVDIPLRIAWKLFSIDRALSYGAPRTERPRTEWCPDDLKKWAEDTLNKLSDYFSDPDNQLD